MYFESKKEATAFWTVITYGLIWICLCCTIGTAWIVFSLITGEYALLLRIVGTLLMVPTSAVSAWLAWRLVKVDEIPWLVECCSDYPDEDVTDEEAES